VRRLNLTMATIVLAAGLLPAAIAQPQTKNSGQSDSQGKSAKAPAPPTASPSPQTPKNRSTGQPLVGRISSQKGSMTLLADGIQYRLDNQAEARKFNGKNVAVTGQVDTNAKTVHVESIREVRPK
jgi:hypothetical protein